MMGSNRLRQLGGTNLKGRFDLFVIQNRDEDAARLHTSHLSRFAAFRPFVSAKCGGRR